MKTYPFFGLLCLAAVLLLPTRVSSAPPFINEFLAINHGSGLDDLGKTSDWIEIKNPGPAAVDLAGWSLTDEPDIPQKWVFPSVTVNAGGFMVVRASGLDRRDPAQPLHTNFTLSGGGEFLALYSPASVASSVWQPYAKQFAGVSFGFAFSATAQGYFTAPTPGADNPVTALRDYVHDTHFDVERGFFTAPFPVTITTSTPGAEIRYTTDGSEPAEASTLYTAPLTIGTTTVLRARAYWTGLVPSNTDTQTYIFATAWKTQPVLPAGFSPTWGQAAAPFHAFKNTAVYRMHTGITNSTDYGPLIIPALTQTLPVLCLTGSMQEIFGDGGLHGDLRFSDIEVPVGVEYFNPLNASEHFTARGALQMHGGAVRNLAKKAFRLDFTGAFGAGPLKFPLFAGSKTESFDQLVLRPGGHDSFAAPGRDANINDLDMAFHASYLRDQFLRLTENAMGLLSPRGRYVHLCLNGLYWGLYELHERPNAEFCASNSGGDTAAWDVLHHNNFSPSAAPQVVDGNDTAWTELQALSTTPVTTDAAYQQLAALLGPERFIDHLLVRMWAGDYDWLGPAYDPNVTRDVSLFFAKNWYAVRDSRAAAPGTWQFFTWDAEISMGSHMLPELINSRDDIFFPSYLQRKLDLDLTRISRANTPAAPWAALGAHREFRLKVADRAQRLLFGDGALSWAVAAARVDALMQELDLPIVAESARWAAVAGNKSGRGLGDWTSSPIMKRNDHWRPEVAWLRDTFVVQRRDIFRSQLRAQNLYPLTESVAIAPFGGNVGAAEDIVLSAPAGVIYYTTDGSDPRTPLTGTVAPGALTYSVPITTSGVSPFIVKGRAYTGEWSALTEVTFTGAVPPAPEALAFTEIYYHPAPLSPGEEIMFGTTDADIFEFLEITNVSAQRVALSSLRFAAGIDFDFAMDSSVSELAPGASLILGVNAAALQSRFGVQPAGIFANGTRLSNSGERIKLVRADGVVIADFTYNDRGDWPSAADGSGYSLHLLAPLSGTNPDPGENWRANGPSPGDLPSLLLYENWLRDFFTPGEIASGSGTDPKADPDGDRLENLIEFLTKSNPRTPSASPIHISFLASGKVRYTWERRAGASTEYGVALQVSDNLSAWITTPVTNTLPTNRATVQIIQEIDVPGATAHFARLRAAP